MRILQMSINALLQSMRCVTALCVLCLLLAAGTAQAQTVFTVSGITYKTLTDSTVQVGNGANPAISTSQTLCAIPATVTYNGVNYTVTSIGIYAFSDCSCLTLVMLPASLTDIKDRAFYRCTGLTSVTLPAALKNIGIHTFESCDSLVAIIAPAENATFSTVDGVLFTKDKTRLLTYPVNKADIAYSVPNGVTWIGSEAFRDCSRLVSLTFPESVTRIDPAAFFGCSSLTSIMLPTLLTDLKARAFYGCSSLTSVTFPANASLMTIETAAFSGCSSLISVTFPANTWQMTIGDAAFSGCSSLTSVPFPASLKSIGDSAFFGCSSLTSVTFPASLKSIGNSAFFGCSSLTSVTFPANASLMTIETAAFSGCSSLTSVTFPANASLMTIETAAFSGCSSLTSVSFPASLTYIKDSAFSGCSSLTSVTLPPGLGFFGNGAFSGCSSLTEFTVSSQNLWFCVVDGVLFNTSKKILVAYPAGKIGATYVVPNDVTCINSCAFAECSGLASVTLPASLTSIGDYAFSGCCCLIDIRYLGMVEPSIEDDTFLDGPSTRILYVPNASSGFTVSKWGATSIVYGNGAVRVTLAPEEVVTAGAQWSIDDGVTWHGNGETVSGLALHSYTVKFRTVVGWITPDSQTISVTADTTTTVNGLYTPPPAGIAWSDVLGQE